MSIPRLTFFCELNADDLHILFTNQQMIPDLKSLKASISLGILDLSETRAFAVRNLNQAGIPVIAWLLLPEEEGYWFCLDNSSQAIARYAAFKTWTAEYDLSWVGVGLDIEPDMRELNRLARERWRYLPHIVRRFMNRKGLRQARAAYQGLVDQIHLDGFQVECYQLPFIEDERKAHSSLLQRLMGIVDIRVDKEIWMLYSSMFRPNGAGVIASYAPSAQAIGLGSTGGGVEIEFPLPGPLSWDELARDLRLAWNWSEDIYIFSLEGCVRHGFLPWLKTFVWDVPFLMPQKNLERVNAWRSLLRSLLWISANIIPLSLGLTAIITFFHGLRRRLHNKA